MSGKAKKVREKKETTLFLAVIPILAMIVLLGVGYAVMGLSPEVLMLVSAAIAGVIAIYLGYTWDEIMDSIVAKLSKTMPAIFILIIVGFMIGSWMIGGTIPMMVFYGLKLISPKYLVVTSFLVTAFVSVCTGTSWGSAGTIGVALMGVAAGMGAPLPIVAGAIVSGHISETKCHLCLIQQTLPLLRQAESFMIIFSICSGQQAPDLLSAALFTRS